MKSVKNFFIERLNSIDHSDQSDAAGSYKTKDKLSHKNTDGNSTTSGASISGEESPSNPSLTAAQTPLEDCANVNSTKTANTPTNVTTPADLPADKSITSPFDFSTSTTTAANLKQKNRRKISLPWGRQSSIAKNLGLSRQHTIDTPSSFRIFRQSSSKSKVRIKI